MWCAIALCAVLLIGCNPGDFGQRSCEELPSADVINHTLAQHASTRAQIERLNPNAIVFVVEENQRCPGKANLVIYYATEAEEQHIRQLLGESFFGIPYELRNV